MMLKYELTDEYGNRVARESYIPALVGLKRLKETIKTYYGDVDE